jgi:ParB family chromosome partitioning protein
MHDPTPKRAMRRGLSALMADMGVDASAAGGPSSGPDRNVPIEQVRPNPNQPRRAFDEERLSDLAASIAARGILQPLIVRPAPGGDGGYEIVAGERRWRAAQRSGLHEVPVIIREFNDVEVLEVAIIENVQRDDLNAIEEAQGLQQLIERFGHTQEQISTQLGKSRSHVANLLRLLKLPEPVQEMLRDKRLSAGHARALIGAGDPLALARRVVERGLSVRETERLAKAAREPGNSSAEPRPAKKTVEKDADTLALEGDLSATLGMRVTIDHADGEEGGRMTLRYRSLDQLDRLCAALSGG